MALVIELRVVLLCVLHIVSCCHSAYGWTALTDGLHLHLPELDRYRQETTKAGAAAALRHAGQGVLWKTLQVARERDPRLQSRQKHARALMDAGTESKVAVRCSADIEPIGIGELRRVAIGGADTERDAGAGRHLDAT